MVERARCIVTPRATTEAPLEQVAEGVLQAKRGFRAFIVDADEGIPQIDMGLP